MAQKSKTVFVCSSCGYETPKWLGKCPECGEWASLQEEVRIAKGSSSDSKAAKPLSVRSYTLNEIEPDNEIRYKTGMSELDRVLGGGNLDVNYTVTRGKPETETSGYCEQFVMIINNSLLQELLNENGVSVRHS